MTPQEIIDSIEVVTVGVQGVAGPTADAKIYKAILTSDGGSPDWYVDEVVNTFGTTTVVKSEDNPGKYVFVLPGVQNPNKLFLYPPNIDDPGTYSATLIPLTNGFILQILDSNGSYAEGQSGRIWVAVEGYA